MASNLIINGSTFSGTPASGTLYKPVSVEETLEKIGTVVVAEAGNRTLVYRSVNRWFTGTFATSNTSCCTFIGCRPTNPGASVVNARVVSGFGRSTR